MQSFADHIVDPHGLAIQVYMISIQARHLDRVVYEQAEPLRLFVRDRQQLGARRGWLIPVGKQRRRGRSNRCQGRLELVRHRVDQRCAQLLAPARGFHLVREVLRPRALQADRDQVCDSLEGRVGHTGPLQPHGGDRLGP
jgi:hypothetical protein